MKSRFSLFAPANCTTSCTSWTALSNQGIFCFKFLLITRKRRLKSNVALAAAKEVVERNYQPWLHIDDYINPQFFFPLWQCTPGKTRPRVLSFTCPKPDLVTHHSPTGSADLVIQPNKGCSSVLTLLDPPGGRQSYFCRAAQLNAPSPTGRIPGILGQEGRAWAQLSSVRLPAEHCSCVMDNRSQGQGKALADWGANAVSPSNFRCTQGCFPSVHLALPCMLAGTSLHSAGLLLLGGKEEQKLE